MSLYMLFLPVKFDTVTFKDKLLMYSITGAGCSMGDTSLTKASTETQPSHLCLLELKELLLQRSILMPLMAPGFRYTHTTLTLAHKLKDSLW